MKTYMIVNADDFGLSASVNRGIIQLYEAGIVTSASVMVNMPGFADAVRLAKQHPGLGVGLHVNLTYGRPVAKSNRVPSLVHADGSFHCRRETWRQQDIAHELAAQWRRLTSAGIQPTHLDSHNLIQQYPSVYRVMAICARKHKIPMRLTEPKPSGPAHPRTTDRFVMGSYFDKRGKARLLRRLHRVQAGVTELHCHPGYVDRDVLRFSDWTHERVRELRLFLDPEVKRALQRKNRVLLHFGQLQRSTDKRQ